MSATVEVDVHLAFGDGHIGRDIDPVADDVACLCVGVPAHAAGEVAIRLRRCGQLRAVALPFDGVRFRVVQAAHLAVIALSVGRAKDFTRILSLPERQANWQKTRRELSWAEKIRMAEAIRDSARTLRETWDEPSNRPKPTSA